MTDVRSGLVWDDRLGVGFYPVKLNGQYGDAYYEKYVGYLKTPLGEALNRFRVGLVERHAKEQPVVDIGAGAGHFISVRDAMVKPGLTRGYDVNPRAVRWLLDRGLWADPWFETPVNVALFDVLEHMPRPWSLLARVSGTVFISIPIFHGREHALSSKHFKPAEHFWYFTRDGLVRSVQEVGFALLEESRVETELGREDIGTFAFRRVL